MELKEQHLYEFGPFRLLPGEHLLLRDGQAISLAPKVFDTLLVLVQNSGHLLEKDELLRLIWPDTFVEEGSLTKNVLCCGRSWRKDRVERSTSRQSRNGATALLPQ